jgi:hypothetical protein
MLFLNMAEFLLCSWLSGSRHYAVVGGFKADTRRAFALEKGNEFPDVGFFGSRLKRKFLMLFA